MGILEYWPAPKRQKSTIKLDYVTDTLYFSFVKGYSEICEKQLKN